MQNTVSSKYKKLFLILAIIAFMIAAGVVLYRPNNMKVPADQQLTSSNDRTVKYRCNENRPLTVHFTGQQVTVLTDNAASHTVGQVETGSGIKYADKNDDFVFLLKGKTALVEEYGEVTFVNCIELN